MLRCAYAGLVLALSLLASGAIAQSSDLTASTPEAAAPGGQALPTPPSPGTSEAPAFRPRDLSNTTLLVSVGYGTATDSAGGVDLEPYGVMLGFEPGYTFRNGFRLGAYLQYGLGRDVAQHYDGRILDFDFTAESWSLSSGLSIGFDVPMYMLTLRHTLGLGITYAHWDVGEIPRSVGSFTSGTGTELDFSLAPGLTLLWPVRHFAVGIGLDYLVLIGERVPRGAIGKLLLGAWL